MNNESQIETWTIADDEESVRLDRYLADQFPEYSRVFLQEAIKEGRVRLFKGASEVCSSIKPSDNIHAGDKIEFDVPVIEEYTIIPEKIDLPIIYEDEHILVINKPAGMVVHPGAGQKDGTLVHALMGYDERAFSAMNDEHHRPGIVHRLDKETSGVMVIARNRIVAEKLTAAFAGRKVKKVYLALVKGKLRRPIGRIEEPIGRCKSDRRKMKIDTSRGKEAISRYKVLGENNGATLMKVNILTGRTHQIRVHMASLGAPVMGDKLYSGRKGFRESPDRHILHAWKLRINHPETGEEMVFTADPEEDFISIVENFKIKMF